MYVTDGTEISSSVKALLETNPFKAKINELEEKVNVCSRKVNDYDSNVKSYQEDLKNSMIGLNVEKQKAKKLATELKLMQKVAEESALENNCDFLNAGVMEKFFKSCGMRFIGLSIKQNGERANLTFVRPAKLINALPVPPMVIAFNYKLKSSVLTFEEAKVYCPVNRGNYIHPHISGSSICMGNYWEVLNDTNGSLLLEGYQDQVLLMDQMFQTYNADSPFRGIDEILSDMISEVTIDKDMVTEIDNYTTYTFKNSKLNTAQNEYPTFELVSRTWFEEWYEMLKQVNPAVLVDDLMARIVTMTSNSHSDDLERLNSLYEDIHNVLPNLSLENPDDWATEEDGHDGLYEDDFDTVKQKWLASLTEYMKSDECKAGHSLFKNLPDLDVVFPTPVVVAPPSYDAMMAPPMPVSAPTTMDDLRF